MDSSRKYVKDSYVAKIKFSEENIKILRNLATKIKYISPLTVSDGRIVIFEAKNCIEEIKELDFVFSLEKERKGKLTIK